MKNAWISLAAVCALVIGVYACAAHSGIPISGRMGAADNYYNLLVQGFRAGQLSLKREVPPALAQLADPYDPSAYASYREEAGDMSYYKRKLYLYFGVTPAVVLFWPYVALTGQYLLQRDAVVIFCLVGFLASVGLLCALWRRYFAEVNVAVVVIGGLALGLATGAPVMLARCDVYEVSIGCGYALTMLAVAGIWKALHEPERRCRWLAAASLAYGLAVGARPSLLFGAVILLVPVAQCWRERRTVLAPLLAATVPLALIGLGLMLYNALRFDSPFEFGIRYQLAGDPHLTRQFFSLRYLWFSFRVYFLEPAHWSGRFPFVHDITVPPLPASHMEGVEHAFGVLTNIPLVWLALAMPLGWRERSAEARSVLCGFLAAVALLFGIGALTLGLFFYTAGRYEMEFLPALVLLAVVGLLSLERAVACKPVWRRAVRWGWSLLLGFSVVFTLLASVKQSAEWQDDLGAMLARQGRVREAIGHYEQSLRLAPDLTVAHYNLGNALLQTRKVPEAIGHYEQALRLKPDFADAHNNLGTALLQSGRVQEAIGHYEQALRINPDLAEAHYDLGAALQKAGQVQEAIDHYDQAVRIKPDYAKAHNDLGTTLMGQGRLTEAISHWERALRIKPDYAEAHNNLGVALARLGKTPEAVEQFEQTLRIKPDYAEAHYNLGLALADLGRLQEAIGHYEQALRIQPDYAEAHNDLGVALEQTGRLQEAIGHYEQALRIQPDLAEVHYNLGLALERLGRTQDAIQHYEQALRIKPDFTPAQKARARLQPSQ
jgi:tetratricopeptide (TPR) repeat protein